MAVNLTHAMDEIIAGHGHAAPVNLLAALVGWQAKWYPPAQAERIAEAVKHLFAAGKILEQIEAKDEEAHLGTIALHEKRSARVG